MKPLLVSEPASSELAGSLRPTERGRVEYWDESVSGLSIRVSEAGRKTWSLMYRVNGRLRRYTLGVYPVLGLADARRKAAAALHEVASGSDPASAKIEARRAETFTELAADSPHSVNSSELVEANWLRVVRHTEPLQTASTEAADSGLPPGAVVQQAAPHILLGLFFVFVIFLIDGLWEDADTLWMAVGYGVASSMTALFLRVGRVRRA